jgi:hypothetical protein
MSLKALAQKINQRDSERDTCGTAAANTVPNVSHAPKAIEATFLYSRVNDGSGPAVEFPPCPVCGESRYWLAPGGRVLCGSKRCAGAQRFRLIAIEYHPMA